MRVVKITLFVHVPKAIIDQGNSVIEEYLNDKLYEDPEFYGDIEECDFGVTDEVL